MKKTAFDIFFSQRLLLFNQINKTDMLYWYLLKRKADEISFVT